MACSLYLTIVVYTVATRPDANIDAHTGNPVTVTSKCNNTRMRLYNLLNHQTNRTNLISLLSATFFSQYFLLMHILTKCRHCFFQQIFILLAMESQAVREYSWDMRQDRLWILLLNHILPVVKMCLLCVEQQFHHWNFPKRII